MRWQSQPAFRLLAGSAWSGGRACLSDPSRRERHLVAGTEPDSQRAAVLLWRHTRASRDPGAHSLRSGAAQAASGAERGRFLEAVPSLKTRAALTTAYAAGLRAAEAVGLKVGDVDSGR